MCYRNPPDRRLPLRRLVTSQCWPKLHLLLSFRSRMVQWSNRLQPPRRTPSQRRHRSMWCSATMLLHGPQSVWHSRWCHPAFSSWMRVRLDSAVCSVLSFLITATLTTINRCRRHTFLLLVCKALQLPTAIIRSRNSLQKCSARLKLQFHHR